MKLFNAFQIVVAFVAWPYLITYLSDATFKGATVAYYSACVAYLIAFIAMVASVHCGIDKLES